MPTGCSFQTSNREIYSEPLFGILFVRKAFKVFSTLYIDNKKIIESYVLRNHKQDSCGKTMYLQFVL